MSAPPAPRPMLVLGAGIIGLTTAIRLREAGYAVTILAAETPRTILSRDKTEVAGTSPTTYTSSGSGGLWMPFLLDGVEVERWATRSFEVFASQVGQSIGVDMVEGYLVKAKEKPEKLPWWGGLTRMTVVTPKEDEKVPEMYRYGLKFRSPVVHMEEYLSYLEGVTQELGIGIELTKSEGRSRIWDGRQVMEFVRERYGGLGDVIVVNCWGIGGGKIGGEEMVAVRGVIVRVRRPEGVGHVIQEDMNDGLLAGNGSMAYCIPRGRAEYSLGGTVLEGDWREEVTEEEKRGVKERAGKLLQGIAEMEEVGTWAGLRPLRMDGRARVEVQKDGIGEELLVVANYGHGGNGVTTCWGCAEDVVKLARELQS